MKTRFLLATTIGLAGLFLSSTRVSANPKQRTIVSTVEAFFQEQRMAGLRVILHNGLVLEGNDQLRNVSVRLPNGTKRELKDVVLYASDDAVYLTQSANGRILQQTISRTIEPMPGDLGAHVGWLYQKNKFSDDVEVYENRSVNGANPLGGGFSTGDKVKELADGTVRAQSGEIITPLIPKAWILSAAPLAQPKPQPSIITGVVSQSLDELRKAAKE